MAVENPIGLRYNIRVEVADVSFEMSSDQRRALEILQEMFEDHGDELQQPIQSVLLRAEGRTPSRIARELGCNTAEVNEALDGFARGGPVALVPRPLRPVVAGILDEAGLASVVPADMKRTAASERPIERREGIDPRWRTPDHGPTTRATARTPEGLMFLLAIDQSETGPSRTRSGGRSRDGVDGAALKEWLVSNGCSNERAEVWMKRMRAYTAAVEASGPPRTRDFED
ncbi:MAG: hypothetical protein ACQER1_10500 [Armatimonadota bacterium]